MARIQVQQMSGSWNTVAHVSDNDQIIAQRLNTESQRQNGRKVRAIADNGAVLDIR